MSKKKVIFISYTPNYSGAEKILLELINTLRNEIKPLLIIPGEGKLEEKANEYGVEYITLPITRDIFRKSLNLVGLIASFASLVKFNLRLIRICDSHETEIIHANSSRAVIMASIASWKRNIPIIWHNHEIPGENNLLNVKLRRLAAWFSEKIICVSNAVKSDLLEIGIEDSKCTVIYNYTFFKLSVPCNLENGKLHSEFNIERENKLVGIIGVLTEWKGQIVFLKAAKEVVKTFKDVTFLIIGDVLDPSDSRSLRYKERLENFCKKNKTLKNHVIFTGFRDDIYQVYQDLDIVVHASIEPDPFPTVILEAMAMGKPIIASKCGGVPELLKDSYNGQMFSPGDHEALAERIICLLCNGKELQKLGSTAQETFRQLASKKDSLAIIQTLYGEI